MGVTEATGVTRGKPSGREKPEEKEKRREAMVCNLRPTTKRRLVALGSGAAVALLITSIVLFASGVARWAQYSINSYQTATAWVRSGSALPCGTDLTVPVFCVSVNGRNCTGVASLLQPRLSLNDSLALIDSVNHVQPSTVFAPFDCVPFPDSGPPEDANCSWLDVGASYPSYRPVFVYASSAVADQHYWLGIWVSFLLVFVICLPIVIVVMIKHCRDRTIVIQAI